MSAMFSADLYGNSFVLGPVLQYLYNSSNNPPDGGGNPAFVRPPVNRYAPGANTADGVRFGTIGVIGTGLPIRWGKSRGLIPISNDHQQFVAVPE